MTKKLIKNFVTWIIEDQSGYRLIYSFLFVIIVVFLIFKIIYYFIFKKKDEVVLFFFIVRIITLFYCFSTDSVCESDKDDEFSISTALAWLITIVGVFVSAAYTIDEIVYVNTFDITEVFNDDMPNGFNLNSRGKNDYYWNYVNLTIRNNNWINLNPHKRYYWRSVNLDHCKTMQRRMEFKQNLENYKIIGNNLLYDPIISEHVIETANDNRLHYQNLEYLVKKNQIEKERHWIYNLVTKNANSNRIMHNNLSYYYYQEKINRKMCNNCIENSFKVYKLHNSLQYKLK